jgi:amino acid adenylation domain-containing protein
MCDSPTVGTKLPPDQQQIRAKCYHPTGKFISFPNDAIEQSIGARFEQMAQSYPDRLAAKIASCAITYQELNQAANRIARTILAELEGKAPVVLLLDYDTSTITAILGVLKTGRAYVPLDPTYPPAQLTSMLKDVQAPLIITNSRLYPSARSLASNSVSVLNLDAIGEQIPAANLAVPISPDSVAYVLYTSGSTGRPKGVFQNHRNTLNLVMRYTNSYHVCTEDRIALLRSFGTNGGVLHTLGALLNGAALFPFDLKEAGVNELAHWLSQEEITLCTMSPTTFRQFAGSPRKTVALPALRMMNLSSEPVYRRDIELGRKYFSPSCIFVNTLGATEASWLAQYFMDRQTQIPRNSVPVGYCTPDVNIVLQDENGQAVGENEIGEIIVTSRYISLGYWNSPALTESRFSPSGEDERSYRTGDLGFMLPDGCLIHLGRKDFQTKLRGYRIDIAEIEGALLEVNNIKEAIVILREDRPGDQRLVAYVVPRGHAIPTSSTIRRALGETLPVHMIPSFFVVLDALPLLPSGKVDRRALPAPGSSRPVLSVPVVMPRTSVEAELGKIWEKVLNLEQVGIHDHFLELGGHSLLATQILSRVLKTFRVELPFQILLQAPTVAELAKVVVQHQAMQTEADTVARLLAAVEALSDDEVRRRLSDEQPSELLDG